ncbi:hypothetical protein ThvES_00003250 [Thiovulum sp. ES]|jgi:hypothetical protein|nr:hypothetical protein ThvES_00003250 [Thiovulum sp. ES]
MKVKYVPYSQLGDAWMKPGSFARFLKTCVIWQGFKFAYYNLKIVKVLAKGH